MAILGRGPRLVERYAVGAEGGCWAREEDGPGAKAGRWARVEKRALAVEAGCLWAVIPGRCPTLVERCAVGAEERGAWARKNGAGLGRRLG
jgi:hypothetical protein